MTNKHSLRKPLTSHCCQDGKPVSHSDQLLNHIVDCHASRRPEALFAEYPISPTSFEQGFLKLTYGKLANAINRVAWWLVDQLGHPQNYETMAYIGPNDWMYPALILGAVKVGYKTLLLSPRNSIEAQLHLLQTTHCKVFLVPNPCPPPVTKILGSLDETFRILSLPRIDDLLRPRCKPFIYDVSFGEGIHAPLVVLHTSGSTGLPKPITWSQSFVSVYAKQMQLAPPDGFESTDNFYKANRVFVIYPPFHSAYIANAIINAITNQTTIVFPLKGAVPSARFLAQTAKFNRIDAALVVPLIVEEMSRSPELLNDIASRVDYLVYAGGDVPQGCGDIVAARMPLINFYGSTEGASMALIHSEGEVSRKNWKYLSFHPDVGAEFQYHADDMYELCIVRRPELESHQQIFQTFPELQEFRTRDLFRRHPTLPHLWSHCGRSDDTIVFLTGEKLVPVDIEQYIFSQNPDISGVLVVGSQRFQPALLVELIPTDQTMQVPEVDLIDKLWRSVSQANNRLPSHAQLTKSHIMFVDPSRPMSRSPKGTIQRAATLAEYKRDLDLLYARAERDQTTVEAIATPKCDLQDTENAMNYLQSAVLRITGQKLSGDDNLFLHGVDSLQTLLLCREIRDRIPSTQKFLDNSIVYAYPTVRSLLVALQHMEISGSMPQAVTKWSSTDEISSMVVRYTKLIDEFPDGHQIRLHKSTGPPVYLLTGSTGSVGSYLLESIIEGDVGHVYCLNRARDSGVLQRERNKLKGLSTDFPDSKVSFLSGDLSQSYLGLDMDSYTKICQSVTHIIHNAWSINFNVPLSFYSSQTDGVLNLVQFCLSATQNPSLMYISSISAVSSLSHESAVPEAIIDDPSAAAPMGYGASKYISEHVIEHAARRLNLDATIARVGQIAGPIRQPGHWSKWEWLPSLVRSSAQIRAIPSLAGSGLDRVDWIPVDDLAEILLELATKTPEPNRKQQVVEPPPQTEVEQYPGARVFNVVNPQTTSWTTELLPHVKRALTTAARNNGQLGSEGAIETVPFEEWIEKARVDFETRTQLDCSTATTNAQRDPSMQQVLASNPAAKLLDFYRSACGQPPRVWITGEAQKASPTLKALDRIRGDAVEKWMAAWF